MRKILLASRYTFQFALLFSMLLFSTLLLPSFVSAQDWNQWRGHSRDGVAASSPSLIESLPEDGLKPTWVSEKVLSARDGGWGSPVVSDGKVFLFAHTRENLKELEKAKYPWLAPNKRTGMTDEEYKQYEVNRRKEGEERSKAYQFREVIYAFDLETGKTVWKTVSESTYTRFPQSGSATVIDGKIYFLGAGRVARCLNAENGDVIWEEKLPGEFRDEFYQSSPVVTRNRVIVVASQMFALDRTTGKIVWTGDEKLIKGSHSSPVIWNHYGVDFLVTNISGGKTVCLQPESGKIVWTVKSEAGVSTAVIHKDLLITYGNSRRSGLRCFSMTPAGAEQKWMYRGIADKGSSPVVVGKYIYVQGERRVACVDLETGKAKWTGLLDASKPQYTSLVASDDKVFYASNGLVAFRGTPEKFEPLFTGVFNSDDLMATKESYRKLLKLDEMEKEEGGQEKSMRLYQKTIGKHGALPCASPAFADGRIILRMKDKIALYDLKK